jgi:hypothetical protein
MIQKKIKDKHLLWLLLFIVITVVFRLFLTADRNVTATYSPHDELWHIRTAFNWIWGGEYKELSFAHLQVYALWLDCLRLLGIPLRLAIDIGWLMAVSYIGYAMLQLTRMAWLAALIFVFLVFHPYIICIFDRVLAETFLTVVSAFVIGAGIELWNCRDQQATFRKNSALIIYVFGFAVAYHIRKEGIVLVVPLVVLAGLSLFDRQFWWKGFNSRTMGLTFLIAPILATVCFGVLLAGGNYLKWGIFARYELAAPGYQRAIGALNSIDVGRTPRQISVTKDTLSSAYNASPTFRELQPSMEGPLGQGWVSNAKQGTPVAGEIGNGWFYWALRAVAENTGWHTSAKFADSKYAAVADELEQAFTSGQLKKRKFIISSFLDPDIGKWLPEVVSSIPALMQIVIQPKLLYLEFSRDGVSGVDLEQYIAITGGRRISSLSKVICGINGWVIVPKDTLIGLGTHSKTFSWAALKGAQRPDVPGAYPFNVSAGVTSESPTELHILTPDGKKGSIALDKLKNQAQEKFTGDVQAILGVDSLEYHKEYIANRWFAMLCNVYDWIGYLFIFSTIASIILILIKRNYSGDAVIFVMLFFMVIARVALFGILDASSWNSVSARYILPIIPAFACMGGLGMVLVFSFLQNILKSKINSYQVIK